jgi:hypothetical protein
MGINMGYTFNYPDFIDTTLITGLIDTNYNRRFRLSIPLSTEDKNSLVVILKNPSCATTNECDVTINRIVNYIALNKTNPMLKEIDKIEIVNLFAYYETYSDSLKDVYEEFGEEFLIGNDNLSTDDEYLLELNNDPIINEVIQNASLIILAWGDSPKGIKSLYRKRVKQVKGFIKDLNMFDKVFYVSSISKDGNPKHAQVWGYSDELIKYTDI